jgi:hypothetical protein
MLQWRKLRESNSLEGLDSEVHVWQQPSAWCDEAAVIRLYKLFKVRAGDASIICVQDAFRSHWSAKAKEVAASNNQINICVTPGGTMPLQLTDAEFAGPVKSLTD